MFAFISWRSPPVARGVSAIPAQHQLWQRSSDRFLKWKVHVANSSRFVVKNYHFDGRIDLLLLVPVFSGMDMQCSPMSEFDTEFLDGKFTLRRSSSNSLISGTRVFEYDGLIASRDAESISR